MGSISLEGDLDITILQVTFLALDMLRNMEEFVPKN
jgi:hypothetical protein